MYGQLFSSSASANDGKRHGSKRDGPDGKHARTNSSLPTYDLNELAKLDPSVTFIDTHCHLDFLFTRNGFMGSYASYRNHPSTKFPACYEGCIAIFCDPTTFAVKFVWSDFLDEPKVWGAFGCHPHNADRYTDKIEDQLKIALQNDKVVALGEIGLDYSNRNGCNHVIQQKVFRRQIQIALDRKLPLIIHSRDAAQDTMAIMKEMVPRDYRIHRHCFTSNWAEAQLWLTEFPNSFLGFTPVVTYSSATEIHDVVKRIPLNRLLLETDAPYFLPRTEDKSKKWSHPGMAIHVAAQIAALRGIKIEDVLRHARENTKQMYLI